jgi:hypothetical protein
MIDHYTTGVPDQTVPLFIFLFGEMMIIFSIGR